MDQPRLLLSLAYFQYYLVLIFFVNTQLKICGNRKELTKSECGNYVAIEFKIINLQNVWFLPA